MHCNKIGCRENMQIFPADNAWNKDISASPVDPYNTQIIAGISAPVIKADLEVVYGRVLI